MTSFDAIWRRGTNKVLNLRTRKKGFTLSVVALHVGDGFWVHPKLPGLKSVRVGSEKEGCDIAMKQCQDWLKEVLRSDGNKDQKL